MSERFKEKIIVSAEVKTYLKDLYHQIEYELREDYDDALEKALNKIDKAIEYIQNHQLVFEISSKKQISYWFDMFYKELLEILGDKENE